MKRLFVVFLPLTAATVLAVAAPETNAQSVFTGRVLTDSGVPLAGAEVFLNGPQNIQRTNDAGEFRFTNVPAGDHIVGVRITGFVPKIDTIEVAEAGEVRREYKLARIETTLPRVPVTAAAPADAKLFEFNERKRLGVGRFLDSAQWVNSRGTRTSDRIAKLPGVFILRGRNSTDAFVANTRDRPRNNAGLAPVWCHAMVWLDGVRVGTDFSINSLDPSSIKAVEWYAGQGSVPAKFNIPSRIDQRYCGVLVLWTR